MKRKWKIMIYSILTFLILGILLFVYAVKSILGAVDDSYAQWDAAIVILNHMRKNNNSWPQNWDDLEQSYKKTKGLRLYKGWKNMKERVEIDFSANPVELKNTVPKGEKQPFKVVWLLNGGRSHWSGAEPNTLIFEYLNKENTEQKNAPDKK